MRGAMTFCARGVCAIIPITRLFALEYTALFDCILPALVRLGLPLPLGGTSNHFRRAALEQAGAWDPFNVTEDADLGIRLARAHKRVEVLPSTTWEEAPGNARSWLDQRTRWLKGWMQTYLVHMRSPRALWRDLGAWRFLGFQVLMGGMVLAALVHPLFYIVVIAGACTGDLFRRDLRRRGVVAVLVQSRRQLYQRDCFSHVGGEAAWTWTIFAGGVIFAAVLACDFNRRLSRPRRSREAATLLGEDRACRVGHRQG